MMGSSQPNTFKKNTSRARPARSARQRRAKSVGRLTQSSTSRLFAGYREPKARLHNQTKNVKINPSPPLGGAFVSYLGIRGGNLSKVIVSHENEN